MTKPTPPATTDAAISEHPWPRTDEERVTFANAASKAWKEHKAAGGKKDDANYPLVLVSFDAWKAAGKEVDTVKRITAEEFARHQAQEPLVYDVRKKSEFDSMP